VYDEFQKPPTRTKEQIVALVMQLVRHAVEELAYQLWQDDLKPVGFAFKAQILDY
jgi:hypothetical protein